MKNVETKFVCRDNDEAFSDTLEKAIDDIQRFWGMEIIDIKFAITGNIYCALILCKAPDTKNERSRAGKDIAR